MTIRLAVFSLTALTVSLGCSVPSPESTLPGSENAAVQKMIDAHGGLEKWRAAPTISFEDEFTPAGDSPPIISQVTVEQSARRAYLDFPESGARIGWDGEKAWSEKWESGPPPRFLALLSYYFLNLPWLAVDPGVHLSEPGTGKLWDEPTEYVTVKMTFDPGAGDTPDDYYLLFLDPDNYQLKASEFTVTYAGVLPPDVNEIKEVIVFDEFTSVDGLVFPRKGMIYRNGRSLAGTFDWRDISLAKPFDESRMEMPSGAVIDTSNPSRPTEAPE